MACCPFFVSLPFFSDQKQNTHTFTVFAFVRCQFINWEAVSHDIFCRHIRTQRLVKIANRNGDDEDTGDNGDDDSRRNSQVQIDHILAWRSSFSVFLSISFSFCFLLYILAAKKLHEFFDLMSLVVSLGVDGDDIIKQLGSRSYTFIYARETRRLGHCPVHATPAHHSAATHRCYNKSIHI